MAPQSSQPAVLYAAKSTEDTRGSIRGQLEDCRAFALGEGLVIAAEYSEQDVSAYHGNRGPQLAAALEHVKKIKGTLIVQHSDRLARGDGRHARHLVEIALWARKVDVEIRPIQDPSTFDSLVLAAVMGERNMEDSRRKSAAVAAGLSRRRSSGRPLGPPSIGFTWRRNEADEREIVRDSETAPIVERIFSEYLAGQPQFQIARSLNADRVPTVRGGKWRPEVIRRILLNPLYAGLVRDGDHLIEGRHDALVSREEWEEAQALRAVRAMTRGSGRPPLGRHLFRKGMLRCGRCGEAMITRSERAADGNLYETYRCYGRYLDPDACPMVPRRREAVDLAVLSYFQEVGVDVKATRLRLSQAAARRAAEMCKLLEAADAEAVSVGAHLTRVRGDYLGGQLTAREWRSLRGELEPQLEAALAERDRLTDRLAVVEAGPDLSAAENELQDQLVRICAAIERGLDDEAGGDAVRAEMVQLFDYFLIHLGRPGEGLSDLVGEDFWIEPVIRERAVNGYAGKLRPVLIRDGSRRDRRVPRPRVEQRDRRGERRPPRRQGARREPRSR